jgi:hypothetical protein
MRLVIEGASESHLVTKELADAGIGVNFPFGVGGQEDVSTPFCG